MDGLLIVDKPRGVSSFNVIRDVRKKYGIRAVGHIGTLDPEASGVLPILVGKATKLSDLLMLHDKDYIAEITLGIKTDSGDIEGNVIERDDSNHNYDKNQILTILNSFKGHSKQIPPMYSAIKIDGKKLYELARKGECIERKERDIFIENIELLDFDGKIIKYKVTCSKGTYIRVLSEDIAEKLGTVGFMSSLRRTRVGNFKIEDAEKFIKIEDILDVERIELNDSKYKKFLNGILINVEGFNNGWIKIYKNGEFKGLGIVNKNLLKRKIVIDE